MSLDHAILGFLSERPMTGYDLKTHCFDQTASHFWTADQAQVYRTLERLEVRGFVKACRERQRSRPDRKVYSVTPAGHSELVGWIASDKSPPPLRDSFLIRLRFAESLSRDELLGMIARRRDAVQARLESLRRRAAKSLSADSERSLVLQRLTLDAAIAQARANIDWLDDCAETLSTLSGLSPKESAHGRQHPPSPPDTDSGKDPR